MVYAQFSKLTRNSWQAKKTLIQCMVDNHFPCVRYVASTGLLQYNFYRNSLQVTRTILGNQSQFGLFRLSQKPFTICHHTTQTAAIARKRFQLQDELTISHGSLEHLLQRVLQRFKHAAAHRVRHMGDFWQTDFRN